MPTNPQEPTFEVKPPSREDWPPALPANWFNISYVGTDVQISIGYMDLHEMALAARGRLKGQRLNVEPVARLTMSVASFAILRRQLVDMAQRIEESGRELDKMMLYNPTDPT